MPFHIHVLVTVLLIYHHIIYPANASIWPNAVSILAHRQRRWANIETTLGRVFVFAGWPIAVFCPVTSALTTLLFFVNIRLNSNIKNKSYKRIVWNLKKCRFWQISYDSSKYILEWNCIEKWRKLWNHTEIYWAVWTFIERWIFQVGVENDMYRKHW